MTFILFLEDLPNISGDILLISRDRELSFSNREKHGRKYNIWVELLTLRLAGHFLNMEMT